MCAVKLMKNMSGVLSLMNSLTIKKLHASLTFSSYTITTNCTWRI